MCIVVKSEKSESLLQAKKAEAEKTSSLHPHPQYRKVVNMVHSYLLFAAAAATTISSASAFTVQSSNRNPASITFKLNKRGSPSGVQLRMVDDTKKAAPMVTGEELETMLQEWDQPLVVDAYATW